MTEVIRVDIRLGSGEFLLPYNKTDAGLLRQCKNPEELVTPKEFDAWLGTFLTTNGEVTLHHCWSALRVGPDGEGFDDIARALAKELKRTVSGYREVVSFTGESDDDRYLPEGEITERMPD